MIQSSHPSSLKLTCSAFLLHLDLDFLPCRFPWRLLSAVLRLRRALNCSALSSSSSSSPRDLIFSFISLNKFSLFLDHLLCVTLTSGLFDRHETPTSSSLSERVETSNRYVCLRKGETVAHKLSVEQKFVFSTSLPF
uniref:Uncharacterized protein n=1 Tax=Sinocyclocheilus rhinocerous TaxID=307959 RepID=A0A673J6G3_9TELE